MEDGTCVHGSRKSSTSQTENAGIPPRLQSANGRDKRKEVVEEDREGMGGHMRVVVLDLPFRDA